MRWFLSVFGGVLVAFGLVWMVRPPAGFHALFLGAGTCIIGIGLVVTGIVWHRTSKDVQTVTIALGSEAEEEAEVLEQLQTAVRHHLNPDEILPEQEHRHTADEREFITMPKEERKLRKIKNPKHR